MQDFKKTTEFYRTHEGSIIRAEYGFSCMGGNPGPYFSVTAEEWNANKSGQPIGRDCLSCGQLHTEILKIPALASLLGRAIPFHLFDPDRGPMHYQANALYWLQQIGKEPRAFEHFKSTICFGALPEIDTATNAMVEQASNFGSVTDELRPILVGYFEKWLSWRLPRLCEAFRAVVAELGMTEELSAARAQYGAE